MSERAIERKHHVGRRTIVKALASAEPPPRKKFQRDPTALNGLHARIDAMLEADPTARVSKIWQHLADDHGVTVTYGTLRVYVVQRRADLLPPWGVRKIRAGSSAKAFDRDGLRRDEARVRGDAQVP
jgi:hypothetical protein